ncbi:ester cyclase [Tateyamaria armeniaca]|uniref:Ester cyclase n=1 Tax=Tateyamaria armeniaca TaxID=2518930 RepID=A0ABW8UVZ1_9RHOB
MPHKIRTLQTYFEEIWIKGNLDMLPKLLSPNARTRGIMGDMPFDPDELSELVSMAHALFRPVSVSFPVLIEQDDWLSALVEITSVAKHSNKPIQVSNQMLVRFDDERMVEIHSNVDALNLFEQLGLLPDNAMAVMLGGTPLR